MNNDGLDGIVVAKIFELAHHGLGLDDDAFQVYHANFVAEAGKFRIVAAGYQAHQRQHCD